MFGLMQQWHLRDAAELALKTYTLKHPQASTLGLAECCNCGTCCFRRPGTLCPDDVDKIAKKLEITPQELFKKYLLVDCIDSILCLLPARKHQLDDAGSMLGWEATFDYDSSCCFRTNGKCEIYDVRPEQCRVQECWNPPKHLTLHKWSEEALRELGWDGVNPDDWDD